MTRPLIAASLLAALLPLFPDAAISAPAAVTHRYQSRDGLVRLSYPAGVTLGRDFVGFQFIGDGWRAMWDGAPAGPGTAVVSAMVRAQVAGSDHATFEWLRIGMSRDTGVVARCGTVGTLGAYGRRLPNRMIGGHRWTAWENHDGTMNNVIETTDLRTVVDGVCYAADRITITTNGADPNAPGTVSRAVAAQRIEAVLTSLVVGRRDRRT